ncbi:MAG: GatB/YqeY domain-containing protein [Bacteroidota bacterium]|nr:GatB/YqeY domain-containing protein [Bacteroidota bacterium]
MSLSEKIGNDLKQAMKAKDKELMQALRAIKSAIILAKTDVGSKEITEADEIKMLQKLVKQRNDSAEIYKAQGRDDLYNQEVYEANAIKKYLPEQMNAEVLENEIKRIIADLGATSMKDMGKVMGIANKKLVGKTDGKSISTKVKELLS